MFFGLKPLDVATVNWLQMLGLFELDSCLSDLHFVRGPTPNMNALFCHNTEPGSGASWKISQGPI